MKEKNAKRHPVPGDLLELLPPLSGIHAEMTIRQMDDGSTAWIFTGNARKMQDRNSRKLAIIVTIAAIPENYDRQRIAALVVIPDDVGWIATWAFYVEIIEEGEAT